MCGIIGYLSVDGTNATEKVINGLNTLEYRGYDSAGVGLMLSKGGVKVIKDVGKVKEVLKNIGEHSTIAIGHTRWATHGNVSKENAHPHCDCNQEVTIVHNGVLSNFIDLRKQLEERGHRFSSETDSEVIAHLLEEGLKEGKDVENALIHTQQKLQGSYAVIAMINGKPGLYCMKHKSPLVIGRRGNNLMAASDVSSLINEAEEVFFPDDGAIIIITPEKQYVIQHNTRKQISWEKLSAEKDAVDKCGYPHFMLKEIFEQETIAAKPKNTERLSMFINTVEKGEFLDLIGCGTSYHALLFLAQQLRKRGVHAQAFIASEYPYSGKPGEKVIALSQSGETADVLSAVEHAKHHNSKICGITNVPHSSLTRKCDVVQYLDAGLELGVAATKTYTSQLMLFLHLLGETHFQEAIKEGLSKEAQTKEIAKLLSNQEHLFYLGRGDSFSIACEGALKIKEISYIHAEAYAGGEMKHGPISLIEPGRWVVAIAPNDETAEHMLGNIKEVMARGANVLALTNNQAISDVATQTVWLEKQPYALSYSVVLQLIAYYTAVFRGYDPDRPRNLAKSVTVE